MATQWISPTWRMPKNSNQSKFENYSLEFPGTGGYVTCTSAGDLFGNNEAFTFSFWCKVNTMAAYKAFFDFSPNAGFGLLALRTQSTSVIELLKSGASLGTYSFSDTTSFHNFCIVYDKTNIKLYIDNVEVISSAQTNMGDFTGLDLHIANGYYLTSLLDCNFSDVCLFKYAASSDQRSYLYNSGTPQNPMAISGQPPTAYYPLGGSSTGSASTLTIPNDAVPSATVFDFNGATDTINVSDSSLLKPSTITISIWFKSNGTQSNYTYLISKYYSGSGPAYALYTGAGGTNLSFAIRKGNDVAWSTTTLASSGNVMDDLWHNAVATFDGTTMKLYIDGILKSTATPGTTGITYNSGDLTIGAFLNNGNLDFNGEISNVQIWNTELGSSEVTTLYNNGVPLLTGTQPEAANLKAWYKLNVDTSTWNGSDWVIGEAQANYTTALDFPGVNQRIGLASAADLGINSTISVWLNTDQVFGVVNDIVLGYNAEYPLYINNNLIYVKIAGVLKSFTPNSKVGGRWYNITIVRTGDSVEVFQDGSSIGTQTGYGTAVNTYLNYIGSRQSGGFAWDGKISNVSVFNSSLSSAQVETIYNNGTPEVSISHSPTGWWKLDNTTTGIQDSVGSNNGTITGSVTQVDSFVSTLNGTSSNMNTANLVTSDLTRSIPYSSYSMVFDGLNDYVSSDSVPSQLNTVSLSIWVKRNGNQNTSAGVFGVRNAGVGSGNFGVCWDLAFNTTTNKIEFRIGDTGYNTVIQDSAMTDNAWTHVVGIADGANMFLYINGVKQTDTDTYSTPIETPTNKIFIGAQGDIPTTYDFTGNLSNAAVFNKSLSEDEILTIYNGGVPNSISSLSPVSWWSLAGDSYYDGTNWICPDLGSAGNNGTSDNMGGTELIGNGPGSTANGIGLSMNIPGNLKGNAPSSTNNAFSINMNSLDRVENVPG